MGRGVVFVLLVGLLAACPRVPLTGRRSLILISDSQELALGADAYREVLAKAKLSTNAVEVQRLRHVGERLAAVSGQKDFKWEFSLIEDTGTVNAFCLPGGKVAVYTGILAVTQTEAGLAVVIGHEIAHAIARHGAERISEQMLLQLGGVSIDLALRKKPQETRDLYLKAYGLGSTLGVSLPFGRYQESEADRMGLIYLARAGYNPEEAILFWQRMEAVSGQAPPAFLSTHPSQGRRIRDLEALLPEAQTEYASSPYRPR